MTVRALRSNASFPLTLTLSRREREQRAETRFCATPAQQIACAATPTTRAQFSLSPRERDGVRGNNV